MSCKRRVGIFKGVYNTKSEKRLLVFPVACGSWSCPDCASRKARRVYARAMAGRIVAAQQSEYNYKLLTLTLPGEIWRKNHSIGNAYQEGSKALTGLIKFLKYNLGAFAYLRVCELQRDGFPHWHIIMVGDGIAPKYTLRMIEDYWRGSCGLGFVKLNRLRGDQDIKRAVGYVLKYLFKSGGEDWGEEMKGKRRYQGSREILGSVEGKPDRVWVHEKLELGNHGRFVGVEAGRVCIAAKDEVIDVSLTGELEEIFHKALGPLIRAVTRGDQA